MNLKIFLTGIFIFSFVFNLFSQEKFLTGINSGLTYSSFRGNSFMESYESEVNYLFGISIDFKINEKLFLSTDLNYERKSIRLFYPEVVGIDGWVIIGTPIGENPEPKPKLKFQTKFQYLSFPIMIKYFIGDNNEFFVNGGPNLSYLLHIKNMDNGKESDLDFNDSFNKTDIGIAFGFGYYYQLDDNNSMSIELRDNYGIIDIGKYENSNFSPTKTNSVNLILNWNFKI